MFRRRSRFEDGRATERGQRQPLGFGGVRHLLPFLSRQRVVQLDGFQDGSTGKLRWRCAFSSRHGIHPITLLQGESDVQDNPA